MRVFVTGVTGQLGTEIVAELHRRAAERLRGPALEVIAPEEGDLDITNRDALISAIATVQPEVIIHPAAWDGRGCLRERSRPRDSVNSPPVPVTSPKPPATSVRTCATCRPTTYSTEPHLAHISNGRRSKSLVGLRALQARRRA